MMEPNHKFYIQSLNRAFAILEAISHENTSGITLSAIAEATNLPVSTVYRILQNLTACHYAAENRDGNRCDCQGNQVTSNYDDGNLSGPGC